MRKQPKLLHGPGIYDVWGGHRTPCEASTQSVDGLTYRSLFGRQALLGILIPMQSSSCLFIKPETVVNAEVNVEIPGYQLRYCFRLHALMLLT